MTDLRKAAEMALKFCEDIGDISGPYPYVNGTGVVGDSRKVLKSLRQALAQSEQEPVVEFMGRRLTPEKTCECWGILLCDSMLDPPKHTKLYTALPKREWVGLTDEEIEEYKWMGQDVIAVIKEVQATLKEKNT